MTSPDSEQFRLFDRSCMQKRGNSKLNVFYDKFYELNCEELVHAHCRCTYVEHHTTSTLLITCIPSPRPVKRSILVAWKMNENERMSRVEIQRR